MVHWVGGNAKIKGIFEADPVAGAATGSPGAGSSGVALSGDASPPPVSFCGGVMTGSCGAGLVCGGVNASGGTVGFAGYRIIKYNIGILFSGGYGEDAFWRTDVICSLSRFTQSFRSCIRSPLVFWEKTRSFDCVAPPGVVAARERVIIGLPYASSPGITVSMVARGIVCGINWA